MSSCLATARKRKEARSSRIMEVKLEDLPPIKMPDRELPPVR